MTVTSDHSDSTRSINAVELKYNGDTKHEDNEEDNDHKCNGELVPADSDDNSTVHQRSSLIYKPKSSPTESANGTKSSLLLQSSKDDLETTEKDISSSKRKGCCPACKNLTFHQFLVFACIFFIVFICVGLPFSLGVLYPEFKVTFNSSNAEAATIVSVATGLITCGGIFGGLLVNKIGCRYTILFGTLLSFVGTFGSYFAMNIWFLVVSLGVLMGLGNAIVYIPSMVVITEQFPNSMMATLIITAARPCGIIILPLLINSLLDIFFWRGSLLLCSGFVLNIIVCGLVATHKNPKTSPPVHSAKKKKIFDVAILKIPKFLVIMIAHSITNSCIGACFVLLVDFSIDLGYGKDRAVIIVTIQAVFAMLARGLVGGLSLLPKKIRPSNAVFFFFAALCGSVIIIATPFAAVNYNNFAGIMVLWGTFVGIRNAVIPVLCLEIVGQEQYPIALGVSQTFIGILTIIAGPIGGMIVDLTGTYRITFFASGSVSIVASIILTIMYIGFFTDHLNFSKKKSDVQV